MRAAASHARRARRPEAPALARLLIVLVAAAVGPGRARAAAADESADALLDEIVAGCEANLALIQRGTARYAARRTDYLYSARPSASGDGHGRPELSGPATTRGPFESELTVTFDYPRLRFDWRGNGFVAEDLSAVTEECYISDGERVITYYMPQFFELQKLGEGAGAAGRRPHRGDSSPNAHNVVVENISAMGRRLMDPRQQLPSGAIADEIRDVRADARGSVAAVDEGGGMIRVHIERPGYIANRWVSRKDGYCVVRSKSWVAQFGESRPVEEYEATARDAGNGAFVLDHRTLKDGIILAGDDTVGPYYEEELRLVTIDLATPPDEKLFTLDGFDLPAGTKIQDRIEGRTYEYGVAAVKEPDIKVPPARGPMKARHWLTALYVLAGIALVAVGFFTHRLRRRAPRVPALDAPAPEQSRPQP